MRVIDFINQGGWITWVLVALNVLGVSLIIWRAWTIWDYKKNITTNAEQLLEKFKKTFSTQDQNETLLKDMVSSHVIELENGMTIIKVIATIAPLLGLFGTVVGIFDAFSVIASKGLDNPADFASGISLALITTIVGLIVAIPHYVAHNLMSDTLDRIEVDLEKIVIPKLLNRN